MNEEMRLLLWLVVAYVLFRVRLCKTSLKSGNHQFEKKFESIDEHLQQNEYTSQQKVVKNVGRVDLKSDGGSDADSSDGNDSESLGISDNKEEVVSPSEYGEVVDQTRSKETPLFHSNDNGSNVSFSEKIIKFIGLDNFNTYNTPFHFDHTVSNVIGSDNMKQAGRRQQMVSHDINSKRKVKSNNVQLTDYSDVHSEQDKRAAEKYQRPTLNVFSQLRTPDNKLPEEPKFPRNIERKVPKEFGDSEKAMLTNNGSNFLNSNPHLVGLRNRTEKEGVVINNITIVENITVPRNKTIIKHFNITDNEIAAKCATYGCRKAKVKTPGSQITKSIPQQVLPEPIPPKPGSLPVTPEREPQPVPPKLGHQHVPSEHQTLPLPPETGLLPVPLEPGNLPVPPETGPLPAPPEPGPLPVPPEPGHLHVPPESAQLTSPPEPGASEPGPIGKISKHKTSHSVGHSTSSNPVPIVGHFPAPVLPPAEGYFPPTQPSPMVEQAQPSENSVAVRPIEADRAHRSLTELSNYLKGQVPATHSHNQQSSISNENNVSMITPIKSYVVHSNKQRYIVPKRQEAQVTHHPSFEASVAAAPVTIRSFKKPTLRGNVLVENNRGLTRTSRTLNTTPTNQPATQSQVNASKGFHTIINSEPVEGYESIVLPQNITVVVNDKDE